MAEQLCALPSGIELCYETFGDRSDPTALLIMGLGTQMIAWHEDFCAELASRGLHVVRFDNRDIGRSTHVDAPAPTIGQLLRRSKAGASYRLSDMAADAADLLTELDLGPAHVVGASMGGMIAQTLAAQHRERVLSLTSIMSNTGSRWTGQPALRMYPLLLRRPGPSREAFVARTVTVFEAIGSTGLPVDVDHVREIAGRSYDRGHDPAGAARQLAAIIASGDRTAELRRVTVPTVVIHGTADRLVSPSGGRATARAIRDAELVLIEGMGHDLPRAAWPQVLAAIERNVARAGRDRALVGS
jgi:pimeloyl-ACP methyl ester carboxylesterase